MDLASDSPVWETPSFSLGFSWGMSSLDQELETSYRYTGSLHWYKQAIVLMLALPIIYLIIGGEYLRCVHVVHVACYVVGMSSRAKRPHPLLS